MRINLLTNPSFETDTQGWEVGGGTLTVTTAEHYEGTRSGKFQSAASGTPHINQAYLTTPIEPSTEYTFSAYVKVPALLAQGYNMYVEFYDNFTDWNYLGGTYGDWFNGATVGWERRKVTFTTPAGCHGAIVYIIADAASTVATDIIYIDNCLLEKGGLQPYFDGNTPGYAWTGEPNNSTSASNDLVVPGKHVRLEVETAPGTWTDITGPTTNITVTFEDGNAGSLGAEVLDATLNPLVDDKLRKGRAVRVKAYNFATDTFDAVFTGTIDNTPSVKRNPREKKKVSITLSATNNVTYLSGQTETRGVATINELRWLITGVPFNINGATTPLGAGTVVSNNDNASMWDEILLTRDTALGYAWVDKNNVLQVWDANTIDTTVKATIGPDVYTDLQADWDGTQLINSVTVNFRRYNSGTETSAEVPYGPYVDSASLATWGAYSQTFTLQADPASEDDAFVAAYAQKILDRNSVGEFRPQTASVNFYTIKDLTLAHKLDLNSRVNVVFEDNTTSMTMRVSGVKHTISPDGWQADYSFAKADGVSTASTPPGSATAYVPPGSIGEDELDDTVKDSISDAAAQAAAALAAASDAADFAEAKNSVFWQTTVPGAGTYRTGDLWFDTDDGNKIYRWSGSAWVVGTSSNLLTPNGRLEINPNGLVAKNSSGVIQTTLDAATGAFTTTGPIISGGDIGGATITGGTIQTTYTYNRGIKLNSSYLIAYDSSGNPTFSIDASTGSVAMKGDLTSGSNISGAIIRGSTLSTSLSGSGRRAELGASSHALKFYRSDDALMGTVDYINPGAFYGGDSLLLQGPGSALMYLSSSRLYMSGDMTVTGTLTSTFSGSITGASATFNSLNMNSGAITNAVSINVGTIYGGPTINGNPQWTAASSGGSANVNWNSGRMQPVTSSRRYKTDIEDLVVDLDSVYALVPRKYTRIGQGTEIGFIAEEALDAGLDDWVTYDDEGQVESFDYYKYVVALQAAVVDLHSRVQALEAA